MEHINENGQNYQNYPSAKLLLDLAYKEHTYESERKKALETKSGIGLAFSGTILTLVLVQFGEINVPVWDNNIQFWKALVLILQIVAYIGNVATLVLAIINFINVLVIAVYKRIDIEGSMNFTANKEDEFAQFMLEYVSEYTNFNSQKNHERSKFFSKGLKYIKTSVGFMVSYVIIDNARHFFSL